MELLWLILIRENVFENLSEESVALIQSLYDSGTFKSTNLEWDIASLLRRANLKKYNNMKEDLSNRWKLSDSRREQIDKTIAARNWLKRDLEIIVDKANQWILELDKKVLNDILEKMRVIKEEGMPLEESELIILYNVILNNLSVEDSIIPEIIIELIKTKMLEEKILKELFSKVFEQFNKKPDNRIHVLVEIFKTGKMSSKEWDEYFRYFLEGGEFSYLRFKYLWIMINFRSNINLSKEMNYLLVENYIKFLDMWSYICLLLEHSIKLWKIDTSMADNLCDSLLKYITSEEQVSSDDEKNSLISLALLVENWLITWDRLDNLFEIVERKFSEGNRNTIRLLISLLDTWKLKILDNQSLWSKEKISSSVGEIYKMFGKIMILANYDRNLFNYLKSIFLDKEKIIEIYKMLKRKVNLDYFIKYIEIIVDYWEGKWLSFWYFKTSIRKWFHIVGIYEQERWWDWVFVKLEEVWVYKRNFLDFLEPDEPLFEFEKDKWTDFDIIPWSPKWFKEKEERMKYLDKDVIELFDDVGTIQALEKLEWNDSID